MVPTADPAWKAVKRMEAGDTACGIIRATIVTPRRSTTSTTKPPRSLDELARLGGEIFELRARPSLRAEDDGKFVAINVETGEYEIDEDDYTAVARLRFRCPDANIWLMRAGYPAAYRM